MNLLAIDVGNTNIVFALYEDDSLQSHYRMDTGSGGFADFLEGRFDFRSVDEVVIGSVVPDVNAALSAFCVEAFGSVPLFVSQENAGVTIAPDFACPDEVGADRLLNALAIRAAYADQAAAGAIVVDFGTATTFDVIDPDMRYCGGAIAPGIHLSMEALERAAAKLPAVPIEKPAKVIGVSTIEAMQSGLFWGYVSMIEGMVKRLGAEMGAAFDPFILATGGLAPLFAAHTDCIACVDDALTLKGLLEVSKHNA